jgi:hypothetical protein
MNSGNPFAPLRAVGGARTTLLIFIGGAIMTISRIAIMTIFLLCMVGATVLTSEAATTFDRSTIVGIDQGQRTITFRTKEGQTWTFPVADPDILKEPVAKNDQVTIEIDLNDQIIKVLKVSGQPGQTPSRDDSLRD